MSAPTAPVRGSKGPAFCHNTGSYASPTWVEIRNCGDLDTTDAADKVDVPLRKNGGYKGYIPGEIDYGVAFKMLYDPADTSQTALRNAYLNKSSIEMLLLDGPVATVGSSGMRATMGVFKFPRQEPLGPLMVDVEVAPFAGAANPPAIFTVAS